jgi:hypothetical protein
VSVPDRALPAGRYCWLCDQLVRGTGPWCQLYGQYSRGSRTCVGFIIDQVDERSLVDDALGGQGAITQCHGPLPSCKANDPGAPADPLLPESSD